MNLRDAFREQFEIVVLGPYTIDTLVGRTSYTKKELIDMMEESFRKNEYVFFTLFKISKLN